MLCNILVRKNTALIIKQYNLVIHNLSLIDAGSYACFEKSTSSYAYAKIFVISESLNNNSTCAISKNSVKS